MTKKIELRLVIFKLGLKYGKNNKMEELEDDNACGKEVEQLF